LLLIYVLSNGRKFYELLCKYSLVYTVQNTYAWIDIMWQKFNSVHPNLVFTIHVQYKREATYVHCYIVAYSRNRFALETQQCVDVCVYVCAYVCVCVCVCVCGC